MTKDYLKDQQNDPYIQAVTEIIRKECEQYLLIELGILSSVEEGVDLLSTLPPPSNEVWQDYTLFITWKKELLSCWYQALKCNEFFAMHYKEAFFERFLYRMRKRWIIWLRDHNKKETIDRYLAVPSRSIAFKPSESFSEEENKSLYRFIPSMHTPHELEEACREQCNKSYPVDMDLLLQRLQKDDDAFWNEICYLFKKLTHHVTSYYTIINEDREEIEQDAWVEASLVFRTKIMNGDLPSFDSAAHLRNYIGNICKNKSMEAERFRRKRTDSFEDGKSEFEHLPDETENSIFDTSFHLEDIDPNNTNELGMSLIFVLLNRVKPWYSMIAKDQEDKIDVLLLHYLDGQSYEDIALQREPEGTEVQLRRLQASLRQDVVRVRRTLIRRFKEIVEKKQNKKN